MDLKHATIPYNPRDLEAWKAGHYELKTSRASAFIKQILVDKAKRRREGRLARGKPADRRFFGEAFLAAHSEFLHRAEWYGSFKWLSASRWLSTKRARLSSPAQFRSALDAYVLNLKQLQSKEAILGPLLAGRHAVAPDLWLFTGRRHRFIEVKLPGDSLSNTQLAGLALIATCLEAAKPVSVEVVSLVDDPLAYAGLSGSDREAFRSFCDALAAANSVDTRPSRWSWREGKVDPDEEHIELRYGDASRSAYAEWTPVALVGRPVRRVFPVQWMGSPDIEVSNEVGRELDFYLVEHPTSHPGTGNPWEYSVYHCGTAANV